MNQDIDRIPIAGLVPFTTIDYPDHTAAVLFTQGCNWRCSYCHNPQLRALKKGLVSWDTVEGFLLKRQGWLQAVVVSGGEPTLHPALPVCLAAIGEMGFKRGLHTAGMEPDGLAGALPFLDWVGMDVKAPMNAGYDRLTGDENCQEKVFESLRLLKAWGKPYQLRFTMDRRLHQPNDMAEITRWLSSRGYPAPILQEARVSGANALP